MGALYLDRIARVVAVEGKGGDEDRAVDAELVHCRHRLLTGRGGGPVRHIVPGPLRGLRLVGVDLRIDDGHRGGSFSWREREATPGRHCGPPRATPRDAGCN